MSIVRVVDDLGNPWVLAEAPTRVVSLVPSLTEAIAVSAPGALVGATAWCTHPAGLEVARVRGTKNPDLAAVLALSPGLVVVSVEENRATDVDLLRRQGLPVWVTDIRDVPGALDSIGRLLEALQAPHREWLEAARSAWADPAPVAADKRIRAAVPIWRRPWMALGPDTYATDVLARIGVDNVLGRRPDGPVAPSARYPRFDVDQLPDLDVVVLPDEPYRFTAADGPEAFADRPCALVDGRSLTWYGPAMQGAPARLADPIRQALTGSVKE